MLFLVAVGATAWRSLFIYPRVPVLPFWHLFWGKQFIVNAYQFAVLEKYGQMLFKHFFTPRFEGEGVIPTLGVEGISKHGAAKNKEHLTSTHAQFELFDLVWIQRIALLNINFIDAAGH